MLSNIGLPELLVVLVIALLLFGTRLPAVGRSLGEGIKNFKKGLNGQDEDEDTTADRNEGSAPSKERKVLASEKSPEKLHAERQQSAEVVDVEHKDVHRS
jgi:sec-independent protein translocase protein TatA